MYVSLCCRSCQIWIQFWFGGCVAQGCGWRGRLPVSAVFFPDEHFSIFSLALLFLLSASFAISSIQLGSILCAFKDPCHVWWHTWDVEIVDCFFEYQIIGAILRYIKNPICDHHISLSPAWSESTNICKSTSFPLSGGALGGTLPSLHHRTVSNHIAWKLKSQYLDTLDHNHTICALFSSQGKQTDGTRHPNVLLWQC